MTDTRKQLINDTINTMRIETHRLREVAGDPDLLDEELALVEAYIALFNARHEFLNVMEGRE